MILTFMLTCGLVDLLAERQLDGSLEMANPITHDEMISAGDGLYGALGELEKRIEHATSWRDFWGNLADQWIAYGDEAPRKMDGRASIYTGETYGEAHDRWSEYRATLVQRLGY